MMKRGALSLCLVTLLLGGCASDRHHGSVASSPLPSSPATAPCPPQPETPDKHCRRLLRALALSGPKASNSELRRARSLAEELLKEDALHPADRRLAESIAAQTQARLALRRALAGCRQRLKALEPLPGRVKELEAENARLQTLIEKLKLIERHFNEQEEAIITPATPAPTPGSGPDSAGGR